MRLHPLPLLALMLTLLAAGCGSDAPSTSTTDSTSTSTATTTDSSPTCSATGSPVTFADEHGLPAPLATTRRALFAAATACDFEGLQALAFRHRDQFAWAQGDPEPALPAAYWRSHDATDRTMARLAELLASSHGVSVEGPKTYVWPAVQGSDRTAGDWQAVVDSGAYSAPEVAAMRADDLYTGYRIGILPDGTWTYFTTGG